MIIATADLSNLQKYEKNFLFNEQCLNELKSIDPEGDVHLKMCNFFKESAPLSVDEILTFISSKQYAKAKNCSHSFRSTCQNVGAMALTQQLIRLEQELMAGERQSESILKCSNELPLLLALTMKEVENYAIK